MTITITRKKFFLTIMALLTAVSLVFSGYALAEKPDWFRDSEKTSDEIARSAIAAEPFDVSVIKNPLERKNLKERLRRFNDGNKIGYVYLMSFGKFIGYYTIKGKISSVNSQLTNDQQTFNGDNGRAFIVNSIGDDGSWGPNEGGDKGIFFFTTDGKLVETVVDWVYSDTPLNVDVPNLMTAKK